MLFPGTDEKDTGLQLDRLCVLCRATQHLQEHLFTGHQVNCYVQGCKYQQALRVIWQPGVVAGDDHNALL